MVLCYHALSETWKAPLSVTPVALERQLTLLMKRGYRGATFTEAVLHPQPGKVVAVTFDDAFRSVATIAMPILRRHGLPATVFVPTGFADRGEPLCWSGTEHWRHGPDAPELRPMTWGDARELAEEGWEIGSHSRSHPRLTELGGQELQTELQSSREAIERELDRPCRSIAYPFGDCDPRVIAAACAAGYEAGAGLPTRPAPATVMHWPRVGVYHGDGMRTFRLKVTPLARKLQTSRGLAALASPIRRLRGLRSGTA